MRPPMAGLVCGRAARARGIPFDTIANSGP